MIVADTSVWIDALRGRETRETRLLRAAIEDDDLLLGDLVLCEVLLGVTDDFRAASLEGDLRAHRIATMTSPDLAVEAARHYRRLRALGVTMSGLADLLIGTFCIAGNHVLLHSDRDFLPMQKHLGLRAL